MTLLCLFFFFVLKIDMLYTGKGDDGTTKIFGCDQRLSKSSLVTEALGSVDEINSLLGVCKAKACPRCFKIEVEDLDIEQIVEEMQNGLFSVQAELAGADKRVSSEEVTRMENWINLIEKELSTIDSFLVAGGNELAAMFDFARAIARRAERSVIKANDSGDVELKKNTLAFINRLSSLLYALARFVNYRAGIEEKSPEYQ